MSIVFMFSGQGSQYRNMGRALFERHLGFRRSMQHLDDIARREMGVSVLDHLYLRQARVSEPFEDILFTHPSIFMLEVSLAQVLIDSGVRPDYVLGSSLGEVAAAAVAGVLSVEQCMEFVLKQASIFERCCPAGGMTAILAAPRLYDDLPVLRHNSELAAVNYDHHFVISAAPTGLDSVEQVLKGQDIPFQRLPVTRGFHSSLIDPAEHDFKQLIERYPCRTPAIPFVSCTSGRLTDGIDTHHFWHVVRKRLDLAEAVRHLEQAGATEFIDLGPSGTLANFSKRCTSAHAQSNFVSVLTPFNPDVTNFERTISRYAKSSRISKEISVKTRTVVMFPGQGSQYKGMGKDLFDQFPTLTAQADAILGESIRELCVEDRHGRLNQTQFTQPAVYVVNALSYLARTSQADPDYVLGHSLGEFNALWAAGAFDFETGLKLVKKRGELMATVRDGGMAAVMNMPKDQIAAILQSNALDTIDFANFNSPRQIVVAGPAADLARAQPLLEAAGAVYVSLKVSAPFHSRYMRAVSTAFSEYLKTVAFRDLTIPVISNVSARPYMSDIAGHLQEQLTSSVRWEESIGYLTNQGITDFQEVGPGNVLTNILTKIRRAAAEAEHRSAITHETERNGDHMPGTADQPVAPAALAPAVIGIGPKHLGSPEFRQEYGVRYAYMAGAMYKGIASKELVVRLANAGYLAFFGSGGLKLSVVEDAILEIKRQVVAGRTFGMNLVCNLVNPNEEIEMVKLFIRNGITVIEAAAFMQINPSLVLYRVKGLVRNADGSVTPTHRIIAKVSRPEVAQQFLEPAPARILNKLISERYITEDEARLAARVPMADDLAVEADSGGHTDMGVASVLVPTIIRQRNAVCSQYGYSRPVRVGAAGGIGSPESAAAAFILGADFIVTGSINQCTKEAGTSDAVKEMLQDINVQDTAYAPAGDMFEIGAKIQVLKRGVFFPARANKLYDLWRTHGSLEEIDEKTRRQIQEKYFRRTFDEVYEETRAYYNRVAPQVIEHAERDPKHKMALIFRWYFVHTMRLALRGDETQRVDYQVQCGPALGAFNQWVKGTELESWKNRHVDVIADKLMVETAAYVSRRVQVLASAADALRQDPSGHRRTDAEHG